MPSAEPPESANVTYRQQYIRCGRAACTRCAPGGPGHGPYWYAYWRESGKLHSRYLGKRSPPEKPEATQPPSIVDRQPAPQLRVRSLGGFAVWRGAEPVLAAAWGRRKAADLFKALLSAPGQRLPRDQAVELLWPGVDFARAAGNLRVTVHILRKVLDRPGQEVSYLGSRGDLLLLLPALGAVPDPDWWDVAAVERLAAAALAGEDPEVCRTALSAHVGEYLPDDRYADWAEDLRRRLRGRQRALRLHLAGMCARTGEVHEAEAALREALADEATDERAARALMRLLAGQGEQVEALRTYQDLADALRSELGVAPSARTEVLRDKVLAESAGSSSAAPVPGLPDGAVTFLLTELEPGKSRRESDPSGMEAALARYDVLTAAVADWRGVLVRRRGEGGSSSAVFARPTDALAAACALQQTLLAEPWPAGLALRARMALHSGEAQPHDGAYIGAATTRGTRLLGLGHAGQVLLSQATADLVRDLLPEGVGLRALGNHELRGLERPEQVYQLLHPALPAEFPPLASPQAAKSNLPVPVSSFIGRERAVAEVEAALARSRLLTLTGAGGCGKTRLAVEVGRLLLGEYPDGVWLAELAALRDPALVSGVVAAALGLREEPPRPLQATLIDFLREKRLLLVLDNCEHLVGACALIVDALLRACPALRILATSRQVLGIAGERTWRVPSLEMPEPRRLVPIEMLPGYEAIQLFVTRAQERREDFALTGENAWAVVGVCRRLDGLPLAIELAAARLAMLSVEEVAARLGDRFRLLTGGSRAALPRHQTLRAMLDWSWELLEEPERTLLRRLSVFAGGWTLEAAEAVCIGESVAREDVLELLGALFDKSLVQAEGTTPAPRYYLLETVREYGAEYLAESGEDSSTQDRHLAHFQALADEAERQLKGSEQGAWLDRLEAEHDNLRVALRWAQTRHYGDQGPRLAVTLWRFWMIRGHLAEGRAWLEALLPQIDGEGYLLAKALYGACSIAIRQGDYAHAEALAERSLKLFRALGDVTGVADTLNALGQVATDLAEYRRATALHEESLVLRRSLGDIRGMAASLLNLGDLAITGADYARAATLLEESLVFAQRSGAQQNLAIALLNLGELALVQGQYDDAWRRYGQAQETFQKLDDRWGLAAVRFHLGETMRHQGEYARAAELYQKGLMQAQAIGDKGYSGWSLTGLSATPHAVGDHEPARALAEESLAVFRRLENPRGIACALAAVARQAGHQGQAWRAAELYRESLALHWRIGFRVGVAECLEGLASVAYTLGQTERAARLFGAAAALRVAIGAPLPLSERARHAETQDLARTKGGEELFDRAWHQGQSMALEDAIAEAQEPGSVG